MPPVLHVALDELAARAAQQVLAQERGLGVHQRHRVLQLVAESEGAARLVVAAARPQAARERLVQQPAVGQHVDRGIRRVDLHVAERALPVRVHGLQRDVRSGGAARALHEARRVARGAPKAQAEHDLALLAVGEVEGDLDRRAGVEAAPTLPDRRARSSAAGAASAPLRPRNSVRSPVTLRAGSSTSKNATRSGNSVL